MVRAFIKLHQLAFVRESTEEPGDGTIIVAQDDHRWWWVYAPRVDGVEYYSAAPEHRIVDPLSIRPGERSRDYAGLIHEHKRIRLQQPPVKLLAALESARQKQRPRIIKRRWRPIVWTIAKKRSLRAYRWLRDRCQIMRRRVRRWSWLKG